MVKMLNVYRVDKYIASLWLKNEQGIPMKVHAFDDRLAIVEGPGGVMVFCDEGVGYSFDDLDDRFRIDLSPDHPWREDENGRRAKPIPFMATHCEKMSLREIMAKCEVQQVEAACFVRRFGSRLEANFSSMLESLGQIGLTPGDYYQGGRETARWYKDVERAEVAQNG